MKQEDKELLLQDLSARLPYGVKALYYGSEEKVLTVDTIEAIYIQPSVEIVIGQYGLELDEVKPYLRPMSSMTEEEKKEFIEYAGYEIEESVNGRHYEYYLKDFCGTPNNPSVNANGVDWLNKKMFDYRGLILKSLAIEVTEDNNPYKD